MKYFRIILVIGILLSSFQLSRAQERTLETKIATAEVPTKVQKALKDYAGFRIEEQATLTKKRGEGTVYAFKVHRKHSSYTLLINKKGKIIGIREGERMSR
jgi:outer membrane lipoprotein-sorting protein